jgi:hypothetical protein
MMMMLWCSVGGGIKVAVAFSLIHTLFHYLDIREMGSTWLSLCLMLNYAKDSIIS